MEDHLCLKDHIKNIPDFPKPGVIFRDITPLLLNPRAYRSAIEGFIDHINENIVVGIETRGFLFAAPVASRINCPLVLVRKPGKLPREAYTASYELEYGTSELSVHKDIPKGNVIIIDDVLATGGTMQAAINVMEQAGCKVTKCGFLIELSYLKGREKIEKYNPFSLIRYS